MREAGVLARQAIDEPPAGSGTSSSCERPRSRRRSGTVVARRDRAARAPAPRRAGARARAPRRSAAAPARRRRARRRRRRRRETARDRPRRCGRRRRAARRAQARRTRAASAARRRFRARACRRCRPAPGRERRADVVLERSAESEIGQRDAWPAGLERGGDVLHAERLDAEEGPRPKRSLPGTGRSSSTLHGATRRVAQRRAVIYSSGFDPARSSASSSGRIAAARSCSRCGAARPRVSLAASPRLTFDADVLRLLPADGAPCRRFAHTSQRFGTLDDLYVVFTAPEGHDHRATTTTRSTPGSSAAAAPEIARVDSGRVDGRATGPGSPIASCCCSTRRLPRGAGAPARRRACRRRSPRRASC